MTVAAVMLVKDEIDIVETTVRWLLGQVDFVFVADNQSSDGTFEALTRLARSTGRVSVDTDEDPGYRQSAKTTVLGQVAFQEGFDWVVPCDADEIWYSPFGTLKEILDAQPDHALFANAYLLNHVATSADNPREHDPTRRLGWRIRMRNPLPKVACRLSADLVIGMGNHDAATTGRIRSVGSPVVDDQLYVHHYPWRSEEQFLRKITNGSRAYAAAPEIGEEYGNHWRQFGLPEDPRFEERVRGWFREWGYRNEPGLLGEELVYDPAPRR